MHILITAPVTESNTCDVNKLQPLKILLVEDNLLNIKLLTILFSQTDVQLAIAENGATAIEKIKVNAYDLVLMDIEMPMMNGYETTAIIRQKLKNHVPIIAMTAHSLTGDKEKCLQAWMNDHITKPIDTGFLFPMIDKLAGKPTLIKSPEPPPVAITEKICNLSYLITITRNNKKIMSDIIDVFLEETPPELYSLSEAINTTNYKIILDISHKIRSSFSLLGISILDPVFAEMEDLAILSTGIGKIKLLNSRVNLVFNQAIEEMRPYSYALTLPANV